MNPTTRLPFTLPDFTRLIWHSAEARDVWEPRLARINAAWGVTERLAVLKGVRSACLTFLSPTDLLEASQRAVREGILVLPLGMTGLTAQYSSTSQGVVAGRPWQYRVVFVRPEAAADWVAAWNGGKVDDAAVGRLLNYPSCCREFFQKVWVAERGVDTTWQMAAATPGAVRRSWEHGEELRIPAGSPLGANIMLRWLGVRLVPHLPCSLACEATHQQALDFLAVGHEAGFSEEMWWVEEMLAWPVEWSALHGVAEIRTPVCTVSTRTDATAGNLVVQREGIAYPAEGVRGLRFPFQQEDKRRVTSRPAFARAFEHTEPSAADIAALNGFGSPEAMDAAHKVVLDVLGAPLTPSTVLDLGCGTGRLLEHAQKLGWEVWGVESDEVRAGRATVSVDTADLFDIERWRFNGPTTVLLMPGRLIERGVDAPESVAVRETLVKRAVGVVLYAYGDWVTRYPSLTALAEAAGFKGWSVMREQHENNAAAMLVLPPAEDTSIS